jgi:hypothetical protein
MPAVPSFIIEPVWEQFAALLPERSEHPSSPPIVTCTRWRLGVVGA